MTEIIRRFLRFLKEEGVYAQYKRNYNKRYPLEESDGPSAERMKLHQYFKSTEAKYYIRLAFIWDRTREGLHVWRPLTERWENLTKFNIYRRAH